MARNTSIVIVKSETLKIKMITISEDGFDKSKRLNLNLF